MYFKARSPFVLKHTTSWRASETLTGVTQSKIGDVCDLLASETVLGVDNAKSGICYIYITSGVLEHKWRASLKLHYC